MSLQKLPCTPPSLTLLHNVLHNDKWDIVFLSLMIYVLHNSLIVQEIIQLDVLPSKNQALCVS